MACVEGRYEIVLLGAPDAPELYYHSLGVSTDDPNEAEDLAERHAWDADGGTGIIDHASGTLDTGAGVMPLIIRNSETGKTRDEAAL